MPNGIINNESTEVVNPAYDVMLERLLAIANTKKIYFIDDSHNKTDGKALFKEAIRKLIAEQRMDEVHSLSLQGINLSIEEEVIYDEIDNKWDKLGSEQQESFLIAITGLTQDQSTLQDRDISADLSIFSKKGELIEFVSPDIWLAKENEVLSELKDGERVVLLIDQNLHQAEGYENTKGIEIIVRLKSEGKLDKATVSIFTYAFSETNIELDQRKKYIEDNPSLTLGDFFVLTKQRKNEYALFLDGVKKVLLNSYCDHIKNESNIILKEAKEAVTARVDELDTYAFDHSILRSSNEEGVWEGDTFFRIVKNVFDQEIKAKMNSHQYPEKINGFVRKAKDISDFQIDVQYADDPYKRSYELRNMDIYDSGALINPLHMPLENGDIFELQDENGNKHHYILIAQECDLMIRKNGTRERDYSYLCKLSIYKKEVLKKKMDQFVKDKVGKDQNPHFYASKFSLDYFNMGTTDIGIVDFESSLLVDLDVLDLLVFDSEGKCLIDLFESFNTMKVNVGLENRYYNLKNKYSKIASEIDDLLIDLGKISESKKETLLYNFLPRLTPTQQIKPAPLYKDAIFNFGLRRVQRLKTMSAKYLLERFYRHLSRFAELHDFARKL